MRRDTLEELYRAHYRPALLYTLSLCGDPAPAEDLARFREEFGEHPREKNYSPLLEKQRGWMKLDTARPAGER